MGSSSPYDILGIKPGAGGIEIRKAYRTLAKKYHPDVNSSAGSAEKFLEITHAYKALQEFRTPPPPPFKKDWDYERASELLKKKREHAMAREQARIRKEDEAWERYRKSGWYDLFLLGRYFLHAILPVLSVAAIILPVLLGFMVEPVAFLATSFLIIMGSFGSWHIYENRKTWFALGKFNTNRGKILSYIRKPHP